jgi:GTPase SAR1 family protein/RNA-binding protein YhbY
MESKDFGLVSSKIVEMLDAIRMRSPLQEADDWIRDQHYTTDRLKIERLSGEALSMDQCYINLAIIEKHRNNSQYAEKGVVTAPNLHRSSLAARQIVETPNKNIQVKLRSLFHRHEGLNGKKMQPRRILIRGRAGVGKTTLCKKMVHSFHTPELRNWNKLFDRVLWLPLRRLKEWPEPPDNLEKLFAKIYFNQTSEKKGTCLAEALCDAVQRGRTLFILDGLDEIEGHWDSGHSMSEFLKDLLNQPNVIITSRPHVSIPASVQAPDVELETIGFYPGQVKKYVRAAFTDAERDYADTQKIEDVKSYLQAHQLVQDLVRIPIQLDALCFTWDKGFSAENVPESMTEIFEAISLKLWRKDIHRLHAKPESECRTMNITRVKKLMREHMDILEALAFSGLYNDILEFDSNHRHQIYNHFSLSVSEFLVERLSFLRTSDPSAGKSYQHYHFLHLTFQEYFAARYFVQQWQNKQPLCCLQLNKREHTEIKTATFLQENKYEPRYDIFWRFVAGLLSVNRDALKFFKAVEEKPRDLLGPMHQYLVMHCLSEVERKDTAFAELRTELEKTLKEWLLVECRLNRRCYLAIEMECPEQVLASALTEASEEEKEILLVGLYRRALIPSSILNLVVSWLENDISTMLKLSIFKSVLSRYNDLPGKMLQSIEPQLDDADQNVQWAAVRALQGQANLTDNMLQRIAALLEAQEQVDRRSRPKILRPLVSFPESLRILATRLEYGDEDVQEAFLGLSQGQVNLTEELLEQVAALLENNEDNVVQSAVLHILKYQDDLTDNLLRCVKKALKSKVWFVRREAVKVFQGRANLTDSLLRRIAALLENDEHVNVRHAAIEVLQSQNKLTDDLLQCVEKALKSEVWFVRGEAVKVFQGRANLTDSLLRRIAALLENDEHVDVRLAAIEVLQEQDKLTDDLLQCVEKALTDKEWLVRHKAVGWFQGRANLTDSLLRRIAALLEDEHSPVRETAFEVLFCQAALSLDSLGKRKSSFFRILLERSFRQHLYCSDGSFIGAGSRHIPLIGRWGDQVSDEILNLRKVWNVPLFKIESTTYVPTTAEASLRGELG